MVLIDTSVLLDVVSDNQQWAAWSVGALSSAAARDFLAINEVVYAELSVGYPTIEELDRTLASVDVSIERIPLAALFLAGKAFQSYRKSSGTKTGVLPDFFIGAHAAISDAELLTRDTRRVRRYFPKVRLIAPALPGRT